MMNLPLLKKLMGMTFSDQDGEALAAIRKANVMLKKENLSWADVLGGNAAVVISVAPTGEPRGAPVEVTVMAQINHAFDTLRGKKIRDRALVDDLETIFKSCGYLQANERAPLFRIYKEYIRTSR
jgi:hypothetical protein